MPRSRRFTRLTVTPAYRCSPPRAKIRRFVGLCPSRCAIRRHGRPYERQVKLNLFPVPKPRSCQSLTSSHRISVMSYSQAPRLDVNALLAQPISLAPNSIRHQQSLAFSNSSQSVWLELHRRTPEGRPVDHQWNCPCPAQRLPLDGLSGSLRTLQDGLQSLQPLDGRGRWLTIFDALAGTIADDARSIDSTSIKDQRSAAGGEGGAMGDPFAVRCAVSAPNTARTAGSTRFSAHRAGYGRGHYRGRRRVPPLPADASSRPTPR